MFKIIFWDGMIVFCFLKLPYPYHNLDITLLLSLTSIQADTSNWSSSDQTLAQPTWIWLKTMEAGWDGCWTRGPPGGSACPGRVSWCSCSSRTTWNCELIFWLISSEKTNKVWYVCTWIRFETELFSWCLVHISHIWFIISVFWKILFLLKVFTDLKLIGN